MKPIVICGFPGVGKSCTAVESQKAVAILDLDSASFSWEDGENGPERNPHFPYNYADKIQELILNNTYYEFILVSSHKSVRDALKERGTPYIIVAPHMSERNEYMKRYISRGSDAKFIYNLYNNWALFLDDIRRDGAPVVWLNENEYLIDVLCKHRLSF